MIARDAARCYQGDPRVDQLRLHMAQVLRSFASHSPQVGYTQGMCFLAAVACSERHFEDSMGCLQQLWAKDFPWIQQGMPLQKKLLHEMDPELSHHLFHTLGAAVFYVRFY